MMLGGPKANAPTRSEDGQLFVAAESPRNG